MSSKRDLSLLQDAEEFKKVVPTEDCSLLPIDDLPLRNRVVAQDVLNLVEQGATLHTACNKAGCSVGLFNAWRRRFTSLESAYRSAEETGAYYQFDKIQELADSVERGDMDAAAGKVAFEIRKYAAGMKSKEFVEKKRTEMQISGNLGFIVVPAKAEPAGETIDAEADE